MDYRAESGHRLRQARELKGLTLKELAARTSNLTVQRISNYEQGIRYMDQGASRSKLPSILASHGNTCQLGAEGADGLRRPPV